MRVELILFFLTLSILLFLVIRNRTSKNGLEKQQEVKTEKAGKKKSSGWIILIVLLLLAGYSGYEYYRLNMTLQTLQTQTAIQIYPNYEFPNGINQLQVPLIPPEQQLSRQAGGWVITPTGSDFRIDYNIPIIIEYNDRKKVYRQPRQPDDDGVRPANSIFRLYGKKGEYATVTIKRGVY